ncbi:MAG TPA: hypothetical protein DCE78_01700 [Bacteroidetes bacterium]|nr:hypothetical protein [Bacteroidota bacterium]
MKKMLSNRVLMLSVMLLMVVGYACKDSGPQDLNIVSMTAGGMDLNGAVSPSNVPTDADIVVTFNTTINPTTATAANVVLTQDYDDANIPVTVSASGTTLTISPVDELGGGILYSLELKAGLLNDDDQPLANTTRTFTTAGTFMPSGAKAHYPMDGNANDAAGSYNPSSNGVVDITYVARGSGQAAQFNGTTSIIEIPNGDQLLNTSNMTFSFWMKTNSTGIERGHFVIGLGAFYGIQFEVFGDYSGAKFAIRYALDNGENAAEDMWMPAEATDASNGGWMGWEYARNVSRDDMIAMLKDNWVHVTLTHDGAAKKTTLYYNGERMKVTNFNLWPEGDAKRGVTGLVWAGQAPDVVNELALGFIQSRAGTMWDNEPWGGYDFAGSNHFQGQLDEIKIYHKVLTADEIRLMYESER